MGSGRTAYHGFMGYVEAQRKYIRACAWRSLTHEAERFLDAGDKVLVLTIERGRSKLGQADVTLRGATVWTIRNGLVKRIELFRDRNHAYQAVGLPLPPDHSRSNAPP
jgi:ketosteroid isomerase-like protein